MSEQTVKETMKQALAYCEGKHNDMLPDIQKNLRQAIADCEQADKQEYKKLTDKEIDEVVEKLANRADSIHISTHDLAREIEAKVVGEYKHGR